MQVVAQARRHAAVAWNHRWKALALTWAVCLMGWAAIHSIPDQYQASARIYADTDAVLNTLLRGLAVDSSPQAQVELLQRTLLSRPYLEKVVAGAGLDQRLDGPAARELLMQRLAQEVRILPQTRNLFTVEYRDPDPQVAKAVVQNVLDQFLEAAVGSDRIQIENARQFLSQQLASYEEKLREAERRRAEFQARYIDYLPSEALGGVSRLEAARARLQTLRGELQDAQVRRDLLRKQIAATPPTVVVGTEGGAANGVDGRIGEAERSLRELRMRFTDQHPDVIAARNAAAQLRAMGGSGGARGAVAPRNVSRPNPLHEQLSMRTVDADAQLSSLQRQVAGGQQDVERLDAVARNEPELLAQFMNLDRDYNVLRRNYEELLGRRETIQISEAARTGSDRVKLEVVDAPAVPTVPVAPKRKLLDAAVLAAGLGAGAALAFLLVQFDGAFYTVHDLRRVNLPVLGGVSVVRRPGGARRFGSAAVFGIACALLLLAFGAVVAGPPLLLFGAAA